MKSMTGFGVARGRVGHAHLVIESRSVNHRFCEVNLRFPGRFASLEPEVMRRVRERFARGKFDLFLREEAVGREKEELDLAKKSHHLLKRIKKELGIESMITLSDVIRFRETVFVHQPVDALEVMRKPLLQLTNDALDGLESMRVQEGRRLHRWFAKEGKRLVSLLKQIRKYSTGKGKDYRRRLEKRLKGVGKVDEGRLAQEAAMMAERADVTEEIVRLGSHLDEFVRIMNQKGALGRKMDFLAQEMGREINTIGAKAQGVRVTHLVIDFKSELERIKEQIQNIE